MDEIHPFEMLNLYTQEKTSTNNVREIDANVKQGTEPLALQTHLISFPSVKIKGIF